MKDDDGETLLHKLVNEHFNAEFVKILRNEFNASELEEFSFRAD